MKAKQLLFIVGMTATLAVVPLSFAAAQQQSGGVGSGLGQLGTDQNIPKPVAVSAGREGVVDLIAQVIDWALYLAGAIAVLFVIIGGYQYLTARGNDSQAKAGLTTLKNALIGLIIIILAYVVVNVVAGFFNA